MKYTITILILSFYINIANAQTQDSISDSRDFAEEVGRFELYPTENTWTLLKLDTKYGLVRQLQYSLEDDKRFELLLNFGIEGVDVSNGVIGQYKLVPTKNMYQFLLIDTINGRVWQIQWSIDDDERGMVGEILLSF